MALHPPAAGAKPRFNETLSAILVSLLISLVLSTILVGNPLHALRLAYLDYSHTPAGGAEQSSPVVAPTTDKGNTPATPAAAPGTQPGAAPK